MALYANPTDLRQILVAEKQTKPGDRYNFKMDHGQSLDVELGGESREKKKSFLLSDFFSSLNWFLSFGGCSRPVRLKQRATNFNGVLLFHSRTGINAVTPFIPHVLIECKPDILMILMP